MEEKRKTKTSSAVKNRYNNKVYGSIIVRVPTIHLTEQS